MDEVVVVLFWLGCISSCFDSETA